MSAPYKFYLLQHGHSDSENTLHVFNTAPERDVATIKCIFGADLSNQDEAEQWDKMREELNDRGTLSFEGDPGLEWFTAHPAPDEAAKLRKAGDAMAEYLAPGPIPSAEPTQRDYLLADWEQAKS